MADDQAEEPQVPADSVSAESTQRRTLSRVTVGAAVLAVLVAVNGWAGWREVQGRRSDAAHQQMVAAARDGLLALTTIDHNEVDRDVERILDASTGAFHDDFAQRAEPFKAAARKVRSTSVGTVREAGLESVDGDSARVLVAMTVMTSNLGQPEQQPKSWRTRVTVTGTPDGFKVAEVEFVP